ncbi:MAG: hypothetical protein JXA89_17870 [Anaerolineae bacterium]|nr:hypothetical protein [Anaerolineae bacterium]
MSALENVRNHFNERSVQWLNNCLDKLGWTSRDLAQHINANNKYLYKTIDRILGRRVKKPQLSTLEDIVNVLRWQAIIPQTKRPIQQEALARKWLLYTIDSETEEKDPKPKERTTLWVFGSYAGLSDSEKKIASGIIKSLPSKLIGAGIRVVVGDSTMLREFIHICRDMHNNSDRMVPNPVMIFGRLRNRDLRDLFEDTINCIPDLAILVGGDIEKGRVKQEYHDAVKADIPIICIPSTGGVAKQVNSVAPRASHLFDILNQMGDNIDTGDLITALWDAILLYVKQS